MLLTVNVENIQATLQHSQQSVKLVVFARQSVAKSSARHAGNNGRPPLFDFPAMGITCCQSTNRASTASQLTTSNSNNNSTNDSTNNSTNNSRLRSPRALTRGAGGKGVVRAVKFAAYTSRSSCCSAFGNDDDDDVMMMMMMVISCDVTYNGWSSLESGRPQTVHYLQQL